MVQAFVNPFFGYSTFDCGIFSPCFFLGKSSIAWIVFSYNSRVRYLKLPNQGNQNFTHKKNSLNWESITRGSLKNESVTDYGRSLNVLKSLKGARHFGTNDQAGTLPRGWKSFATSKLPSLRPRDNAAPIRYVTSLFGCEFKNPLKLVTKQGKKCSQREHQKNAIEESIKKKSEKPLTAALEQTSNSHGDLLPLGMSKLFSR